MGLRDLFKRGDGKSKDASQSDTRGVAGNNPFSGPDAAYQPHPGEVTKPVEHDPSATFAGGEAVIAVRNTGKFDIPDADNNKENHYFWQGVEKQLNTESQYEPNNEALSIALKLARETAMITKMKAEGGGGAEAIDVSATIAQIEHALTQSVAA